MKNSYIQNWVFDLIRKGHNTVQKITDITDMDYTVVSGALQNLKKKGLVQYDGGGYWCLTIKGEKL